MVIHNPANDEFEELISTGKTLVDFWASWCGPCQMLSPVVDEVAEERSDIKVCKVNVDEQQELAMQFRVMSIPTLVVIKEGQETNRSVGFISKEEIAALI